MPAFTYQDRWVELFSMAEMFRFDPFVVLSDSRLGMSIMEGNKRFVMLSGIVKTIRPSNERLATWIKRIEVQELLEREMQ